jgi:hypothetical protein
MPEEPKDEVAKPKRAGRFRLPKVVRNVLISVVVLVVLLVGAGVAYTWYVGQGDTVNTTAIAPEPVLKPTPTVTPTKPSPSAKVGASVTMLSSPVSPGSNASISVKTNAGSTCKISVVYDKTASTDSGLTPKVADDYGAVSWSWTVEPSAPLGKWPVKVTCVFYGKSAFVQGDLVVEKPVVE